MTLTDISPSVSDTHTELRVSVGSMYMDSIRLATVAKEHVRHLWMNLSKP